MPTVMSMHWPEVTSEQYNQARKEVDWEGNRPHGAKFHVAWVATDGLRVLDLWNSQKDFEQFVQTRLMPVLEKIGVQGQPRVEFAEAESVFAPDV